MPTIANTTVTWNDLVKLSPVLWFRGASVEMSVIQPGMDIWQLEQMDQYNRDFSVVARSGFSNKIPEGGDYPEYLTNQGDTLSMAVVKRGKSFTITEDLLDGNKYRDIRLGMEDLGTTIIRGIGLDQHHFLLSFAFSSTYVDRDGKTVTNGIAKGSEALFADTHTMESTDTFDNLVGAVPLNEPNLRAGEDLTVDYKDENGFPVSCITNLLVRTRDHANNHMCQRLFSSKQQFQQDAAERNINVYGGQYRDIELFYAATLATGKTDTTNKGKYWAAYSSDMMKDAAIYALHTSPTPAGPFEDPYNGGMLWRSKARYDLGIGFAQVGFGSNSLT